MDGNTLSETNLLNISGSKLKVDSNVNDYDLFNKILGLAQDYVWEDCENAMDYCRTMYNIMYPIIKHYRKIIEEQSTALVAAKALKKAEMKREIAELHNSIEVLRQDNKDLLFTNVAMIDALKRHGVYNGEASRFEKLQ